VRHAYLPERLCVCIAPDLKWSQRPTRRAIQAPTVITIKSQYDQDLGARMKVCYKDCLSDWNAPAHMSKRDYQRSCRARKIFETRGEDRGARKVVFDSLKWAGFAIFRS